MKKTAVKGKRTARVLSHDGRRQFWTTQSQFWTWVRAQTVCKLGDFPLTGQFRSPDEERLVVRGGTVLNLSAPNHLSEFQRTCARFR